MNENYDLEERKEHPFVLLITIVSVRGLPKITGGGLFLFVLFF